MHLARKYCMTMLENLKCSLKCSTDANDEGRKKVVNIYLVMTEMMSSSGRWAIVVHVQ